MKKAGLLLISVFALSILIQGAGAVEISLKPEKISTMPNKQVSFNLTIKNNQNEPDSFLISVSGPHLEWLSLEKTSVTLDPGLSESINIYFYPMEEEVTYTYEVRVTSVRSPKIVESKTFYLATLPSVRIEELSTEQADKELEIDLTMESVWEQDVEIALEIRDSENNIVWGLVESAQVEGTQTITKTVSGLLAGSYSLFASVSNKTNKTLDFVLDPVHSVVAKTQTWTNPFYKEFVVDVYNDGNTVEEGYTLTQTITKDWFTGFVTKPVTCREGTETKECDFVIERLEPGATAKVVYRIEWWPTAAQIIAGVCVILAIGGLTFIHASKPRIRKTSIRKGPNKHSIIIEVKNPFRQELKNVIIRDWVSPLAQVLHKEFEHLIPVMKKSEAGTELIWNLGEMKPREVRLLGYKIRTAVQGSLKMPRAHIRFVNKKGERVRIFSSPLIIK